MSFLAVLHLVIQALFAIVGGVFVGLLLGCVGFVLVLALGLVFELFMMTICSAFGKEWRGSRIEW